MNLKNIIINEKKTEIIHFYKIKRYSIRVANTKLSNEGCQNYELDKAELNSVYKYFTI